MAGLELSTPALSWVKGCGLDGLRQVGLDWPGEGAHHTASGPGNCARRSEERLFLLLF